MINLWLGWMYWQWTYTAEEYIIKNYTENFSKILARKSIIIKECILKIQQSIYIQGKYLKSLANSQLLNLIKK